MATFPNFDDDATAHDLQPSLNDMVGVSGSQSNEVDFNHHVPHMLCKFAALNKKHASKLIRYQIKLKVIVSPTKSANVECPLSHSL